MIVGGWGGGMGRVGGWMWGAAVCVWGGGRRPAVRRPPTFAGGGHLGGGDAAVEGEATSTPE